MELNNPCQNLRETLVAWQQTSILSTAIHQENMGNKGKLRLQNSPEVVLGTGCFNAAFVLTANFF